MLEQTSVLIDSCSPNTVRDWPGLPTTYCVAFAWVMPCYATPLVTKCYSPSPCLGKQILQLYASADIANLLPTKTYYLVRSICVLGAAMEYYINLSLVFNSLY